MMGLGAFLVTLTIINGANVPAPLLDRAERAVQTQVNAQIAPAWDAPRVRFGPDGWPVYILPRLAASLPSEVEGFHSIGSTGVPFIEVQYPSPDGRPLSILLSHEVAETDTDPYGTGFEICDPLNGYSYAVGGVRVAAWITPRGGMFKPVQGVSRRVRRFMALLPMRYHKATRR